MGGAKLINVTKHSPDSQKENMLLLLTGLGKGFCCILLPQKRPEDKVRLKLRFAHTRRGRDVIAGNSAPISQNRNLFSQNSRETASTGKQIIMVGRLEVLSQSLPIFRYRLFVVYQKYLNVSEQTCNVYWSKI